MFDNTASSSVRSVSGALEINLRARNREKEQAFIVANYQTKKSSGARQVANQFRGLLVNLLSVLKIL